MNKACISLLIFSALSPLLYATEHKLKWVFHSKHATYEVPTTISESSDNSLTISHELPSDFYFSKLMAGKIDLNHDEEIPKQEIHLDREAVSTSSRQTEGQLVEAPFSQKITYTQGAAKLQVIDGISYMAQLMTDQSLPHVLNGAISLPLLPSYVFPANAAYHTEVQQANFNIYSSEIVTAEIYVRFGDTMSTYNVALIRQVNRYCLLVSHKALTHDQLPAISDSYTQVVDEQTNNQLISTSQPPYQLSPHDQMKAALQGAGIDLEGKALFITAIPTATFHTLTGTTPLPVLPSDELNLKSLRQVLPSAPPSAAVIDEHSIDITPTPYTGSKIRRKGGCTLL